MLSRVIAKLANDVMSALFERRLFILIAVIKNAVYIVGAFFSFYKLWPVDLLSRTLAVVMTLAAAIRVAVSYSDEKRRAISAVK